MSGRIESDGKVPYSNPNRVYVGNVIQPKDINTTNDRIDRNRVTNVIGGVVKQTTNGTSIIVKKEFDRHPFQVSVSGNRVVMRGGYVWSQSGGFTPAFSIDAVGPQNTFVLGTQYSGEFISPAQSLSPWLFAWQLDSFSPKRILWMQMGMQYPTLRYTKPEDYYPLGENVLAQPIATIYKGGQVQQWTTSDIWQRSLRGPFAISVYKSEQGTGPSAQFFVRLQVGAVNSVIPVYLYDGKSLSNATGRSNSFLAGEQMYVWLKCTGQVSPSAFPTKVEVLVDGDVSKPVSSDYTHIMIGTVEVQYTPATTNTPESYAVSANNIIESSLWAEAHRYATGTAEYFFYKV